MPLKKLSEGSKGGIKKGGVKRASKPKPKKKPRKILGKTIRKPKTGGQGGNTIKKGSPDGSSVKPLTTGEQQSGGRAGLHGRPKEFTDKKNWDKISIHQTNKQKAENKQRDDKLRAERKAKPTKSLKQRKADANKKYEGLSAKERSAKSLADLKAQRAANKASTGKGGDRIKTGKPGFVKKPSHVKGGSNETVKQKKDPKNAQFHKVKNKGAYGGVKPNQFKLRDWNDFSNF